MKKLLRQALSSKALTYKLTNKLAKRIASKAMKEHLKPSNSYQTIIKNSFSVTFLLTDTLDVTIICVSKIVSNK
jgi:hypothetical protein